MRESNARWLEPDVESCREIVAALTDVELAELGTAMLRACRSSCAEVPEPVLTVELIGLTRRSWPEAHRAFDDVRDVTLQFERAQRSGTDPTYKLLFVAENAAKVLYNAAKMPAPFDADSGLRLLVCVAHFVQTRALPELREMVLSLMNAALARTLARTP